MKSTTILTVSALTTLLLSGCSIFGAIGSLRSFGTDPLVVAATENPYATKTSVMAVGKQPTKTQPTKMIQGTCYDFQLTNGEKTSPFYVAFNKKDQVVAASFLTCAEAESRGVINNELPHIERKK
jgi:osmotically inducible lipoprotein OsmE